MVDAIVSSLVQQLTSFIDREMQEEVRPVVGVEKEVQKFINNLRSIEAVLVDAEQRQVKEETVKVWLDQLKDASYDMEDVLDEWKTARLRLKIEGTKNSQFPQKKVRSFLPTTCFGFKNVFLRHDIAHKIKEVNENLDAIAKAKTNFTFSTNVIKSIDEKSERVQSISLIDESEIFGRVIEKNTLISKLVCECSSEQKDLHIISLVGMGGIGKTTLAQLAYNDVEVKRNFDKTIWVCVSDPFDEFRIARAILEGLEGSAFDLGEFQSLMNRIQNSILGKQFLLVLDDVWNENYLKWEPFYHCLKNGLHGSKILITTRKETVARMMRSTDIISINILAEEDCWSLLERLAFFGRSTEEHEKLEQIGRKIASKCKGLPLAAKTMGSLLYSKSTQEEWQNILSSEMWEQEELENGLFTPLLLSYYDLPSMVKRCFSYCAIFPKDYQIHKDELIKLWMAQGYLKEKKNKEKEIIGEEYFNILASRSFFQEFKEYEFYDNIVCKMHDIVHDFAQFVSRGECLTVTVHNSLEESLINPLHMKVCTSALRFGRMPCIPDSIYRVKRLRSLLIDSECIDLPLISDVLEELFCKLTCLRVLDLGFKGWFGNICKEEIPTNIEKLIHLRYINLSGHEMQKLPEALCELYNLEILDVSRCENLKKLPQGIGKLINMRYLLNDHTYSLSFMPVGIEKLTNLRRLTNFVCGSKGCTIGSLKDLKLLQECKIESLGNELDVGEAQRLELVKKKNLLVLKLNFRMYVVGRKNEKDEQLLQALQPPLSLKELRIWYYRGNSIFPNWMMSLTKMTIFNLRWCQNCEQLPPLGKLPSLETLCISEMGSLKKIGNEFLGIESNDGSSSSSSAVSFPKLKLLRIGCMGGLEEWDYGIAALTKGEIMPRLSKVWMIDCPILKALPDHILQTKTLQNLDIWACPILRERYGKGTGEDWPKISHIPDVSFR